MLCEKNCLMITSKTELRDFLKSDNINYLPVSCGFLRKLKSQMLSNPISEQKHIWNYIREMRYVEYFDFRKKTNAFYWLFYIYHLYQLRRESHITGFQIPPNVCGKGLTIWHWGPIIINPAAKIGENCTLYPGVLIGHKNIMGGVAIIGNNVFIGAGTKIIGPVKIGDNVTIGQNCVITKDIPSNSVVVIDNKLRYL